MEKFKSQIQPIENAFEACQDCSMNKKISIQKMTVRFSRKNLWRGWASISKEDKLVQENVN